MEITLKVEKTFLSTPEFYMKSSHEGKEIGLYLNNDNNFISLGYWDGSLMISINIPSNPIITKNNKKEKEDVTQSNSFTMEDIIRLVAVVQKPDLYKDK